ncbi:hypothetical protein KOJCDNHJ_02521 [Xanthomonas citri pv. punicae]|nr:hypothetical protein FICKIIDM_04248 [Xanthomonas citri pv. punicae]UIS29118.1 hypothetical protein KOJCDNHJ_02521 [Xanthomonas citri pv. punicae]
MSEGRQQPVRNAVLPVGRASSAQSFCVLGAPSGVSSASFFDVPAAALNMTRQQTV